MTILYFYVTLFTIYFVFLALASLKKQKRVRDKYTSKDSNMCIVVYASGEVPTIENLIKQLKTQNFPHERYSIYVVLDKVENPPEILFQADLGINVININNIEPIGKSQAYSILAEKLSEVPNLDAFVFMDCKNYVDNDFLSNINFYLTKYSVFMPMVNYIGEYGELKFWDCVRATYIRYISKFLYKTRTRLGFSNLINTDSFVIKKDLLNKIGIFDFKDKTSELKYTFKLAQEGYQTAFVEDVKVYTAIENYDLRIPSLSKRVQLVWNNFTKCKNFTSTEYLYSQIMPNWLGFACIYGLLLSHSYTFPFIVNYTIILITALLLLLAFCISLFNAGIYAKEYLYLFSYPLYSTAHIIKNLPPIRGIRNFIKNRHRKHNIEKMVTNVIISDGQKDSCCKIELISDDGLAKVRFINNKKVYTTKNNHLRMVDALKELSSKLNDYGLFMKTCQNCKYFQPVVDGTTNMIKGQCKCNFDGRVEGDIIPTLIWNTCQKFEKQNVVNLF